MKTLTAQIQCYRHAAAALQAMENMVVKTADFDVHIEQVTERLKAAGLGSDIGSIAYAGRASSGSGQVQVKHQLGWIRLDLA